MKEYRKIATVKAKIFEQGDEDGFIHRGDMMDAMEDARHELQINVVPFIKTLENQCHKGEFGKYYVCVGINNERWLVTKDIFESTYEEIKGGEQ